MDKMQSNDGKAHVICCAFDISPCWSSCHTQHNSMMAAASSSRLWYSDSCARMDEITAFLALRLSPAQKMIYVYLRVVN